MDSINWKAGRQLPYLSINRCNIGFTLVIEGLRILLLLETTEFHLISNHPCLLPTNSNPDVPLDSHIHTKTLPGKQFTFFTVQFLCLQLNVYIAAARGQFGELEVGSSSLISQWLLYPNFSFHLFILCLIFCQICSYHCSSFSPKSIGSMVFIFLLFFICSHLLSNNSNCVKFWSANGFLSLMLIFSWK